MSDAALPAIVHAPSVGETLIARAQRLAERVGLPVCELAPVRGPLLHVTAADVELWTAERLRPLRLADQLVAIRRRALAGRGLELARACGWPLRQRPIIDATAGLGRDAAVLALLGAQVTMVEREPLLAAWLHELARGLVAAPAVPHEPHVLHGDSLQLLAGLQRPDAVVYLDPMFAAERTALPRRDAQALAALASVDDGEQLLDCALSLPCARIVVKRGRRQPPLRAHPAPSHVILGRAVRFDVYVRGSAGVDE